MLQEMVYNFVLVVNLFLITLIACLEKWNLIIKRRFSVFAIKKYRTKFIPHEKRCKYYGETKHCPVDRNSILTHVEFRSKT